MVDWLIDVQGVPAASVVVLTRRLPPLPHPRGATVLTVDVADAGTLLAHEGLAALGRVGGILHLAAVLEDGVLANVDAASLRRTAQPKVVGPSLGYGRPETVSGLPIFFFEYEN